MQPFVFFTCALTLFFTSFGILAQNLPLETNSERQSENSSHVESQHVTCKDQLKFPQDTLKIMQSDIHFREKLMKEFTDLGKTIEKLTLENENLKHQLQESRSCKDAITKLTSTLDIRMTALSNEIISEAENIKSVINITALQSENKMTEKSVKNLDTILSGQRQLGDIIQNLTSEDKSFQTEDGGKLLTQVMSQLAEHDATLVNVTKQLTCAIGQHKLNMTLLNGNNYYFSYDQPWMNWYDANKFCRSHGMHLVSVETKQEWELLKPEVSKLHETITWPWSSGSDAAEEGKWKWTDTGSDVTFVGGRYSSMTDSPKYNCLYLYPFGWDDEICSMKMSFICEADSAC